MRSSAVFVGLNGQAFCLDRATGEVVWQAGLKGTDYVTVLLDGDLLFAATRGEIFCLHAATGDLVWRNKMPGQGLGLVSIASAAGSSNPGPAEEERRRQVASD
jgi:outer membrane protein assembly factor BamB